MDDKTANVSRIALVIPAAMSGLLLFLSDFPLHFWPVQILALTPLLYGLVRKAGSLRHATSLGIFTGFFYVAPLLLVLRFPPFMAVGLAVYQILIWTVFCAMVHGILRWKSPWSVLGAGAAAVLLEWLNFSLLPIWGTAQCFARTWSAAPECIQIVSLTGMTGLVFFGVSSQAGIVLLLVRPGERARLGVTVPLLAAVFIASCIFLPPTPGKRSIRVGAMGWTMKDLEKGRNLAPYGVSMGFYEVLLQEAVNRGARLVVSPETGFRLSKAAKEGVLRRLSTLAREHGVMLVVGYFDEEANDNRIAFIDPKGKQVAEYRKTHLIPFMEDYSAGDGRIVALPFEGFTLGGMICQDDNFTDLARGAGRKRVQLMAVPTNDWLQVKDFHLENAVFRTVENRYAMVRGASNGISAIVSADGRTLAKKDHFQQGPGVIVADLFPPVGGTPYSRFGDWPVLASIIILALGFLPTLRNRLEGIAERKNE